MSENKTQANQLDVTQFLASVEPENKRQDSLKLLALFEQITEKKPVMWGTSIIGFGQYHYKYESGREGDFMITGFSPRKQNISLYIMPGFSQLETLLAKLGKHKTGKSCLYINKLADVNEEVLSQIIRLGFEHMCNKYTTK
ncbi:DUF1801 domain-containing protein [Thalassotalea sp. Y01]|uniref:DUF1801 domain-containing protein n=1 Tax=Thalassotalea sp. Y01 TaxID=2729613 RepID=UPI00145DC198|nr:DUF1801 domain-containing protein [Thalassotalea sp. Y01]NMP17939.1 DUF1801 domain-containing protein [Thalassotalea sp. Y01]